MKYRIRPSNERVWCTTQLAKLSFNHSIGRTHSSRFTFFYKWILPKTGIPGHFGAKNSYILKPSTNHTPGALRFASLTSYLFSAWKGQAHLVMSTVSSFCRVTGRRHRVSPCRSAYFASPWWLLTLDLRRRSRETAYLFPESWWHLTMRGSRGSLFMIIPNTKRHPNNTKTDQFYLFLW